ncbi:MAG TPA: D-2-hydroxyacid dehydrogenase [Bryobacteraceae bacterium]|nr:D-2-hydroxyacid dehydrogenase [Bryobacteraceae bacterium]
MDHSTVLVLADPTDPLLGMLEKLPGEVRIAAGNRVEAFADAAPEADVILNWTGSRELLRQVWRMAPRVHWIHARSAGLDEVLFPELIESPVPLTNARGVFSEILGEFVIAAVLFFAKGLRRMVRSQEAGVWDQFDTIEVAGQTMGVMGMGDIGNAAARRAEAMGMRVMGLGRADGRERKRDLLAGADYVVLSLPLTPETRGIIGEAELRAMKPAAVLINVGRGPLVDEAALIAALRERRIGGAAVDVFNQEPLPAGHPYFALDNLLLSAHAADHTPDWQQRAMQLFLENFERYKKGEPLRNVVDKRRGY